MNFSEFAKRKVAGVPVLYLIAAGVVIFAVVAWKMKPTAPKDTTQEAVSDNGDVAESSNDVTDVYGGFQTKGSVSAAPVALAQDAVTEETNESWAAKAVRFLIDKNANPGEAQAAIAAYLEGEDLSYEQGVMRDAAIRELNTPPDGVSRVGQAAQEPARKQFNGPPGNHTVKGGADNTISKLAMLYYSSNDWLHYSEILAVNQALGRSQDSPLSVGTVVKIPAYSPPKYANATKDQLTYSKFAAANGMSEYALSILNPSLYDTPMKVGRRLRVA